MSGRYAKPRVRADGVTLLSAYAACLFLLPSNYVVAVVGAVGAPAQLTGLALLGWWTFRRITRSFEDTGRAQPVRRAAFLFTATVLVSFVVAVTRPSDGVEASAANRGVLAVAAWLGILLIANDDVSTRARLETLVRRVTFLGGFAAAIGVAQFVTQMTLTEYLLLPGLAENAEAGGVTSRAGFTRPAGTALHPIEFGVVVSMTLPLALHFAVSETSRRPMVRWFPVAAVGLAIPLSISRSAILCTAMAMAVVLPTLARRTRRLVLAVGVGLLGVVYVSVPGMLGAILKLFTGISGDDSAASRTDSYSLAFAFIENAPVFGRGFYTFLPEYRILDNQYLVTLIELGLVGLVALLVLFATGLWVAQQNRRASQDARARQLAQAMTASVAAGAVAFAFFDAFSFPMVPGLLFLLLGLIGASHRIASSAIGVAMLHDRPMSKRLTSSGRPAGRGSLRSRGGPGGRADQRPPRTAGELRSQSESAEQTITPNGGSAPGP